MEGATYCSKCKKRTPDVETKLQRKKRCFYLKSACKICFGGKAKRVSADPGKRVKGVGRSSSGESSSPTKTEVKQIAPEIYNALSEIYPTHFQVNGESRDVMIGESVDLEESTGEE